MTYSRENLEALIEDRFDARIRNPYVQNNRLVYLLGLHNPDMLARIGHPKEGVLLGGISNRSKADISYSLNAANYQTRYRIRPLGSGVSIEEGGVTPPADRFAEDDYGTATWRYWHQGQGMRIRASSLRHAGSEGGVRRIVEQTVGDYAELDGEGRYRVRSMFDMANSEHGKASRPLRRRGACESRCRGPCTRRRGRSRPRRSIPCKRRGCSAPRRVAPRRRS